MVTDSSRKTAAARESLLDLLSSIKDPELPVVNIVELGIVRDIVVDGASVQVDVTPTYSGCPAMQVIEQDIVQALEADGFTNVKVRYVFSPPWTTDWLSERTKTKLREFGIAPPMSVEGAGANDLVTLRRMRKTIPCPYCGSANTEEKSEFGSTACKAIHYCNSCHQPFDYFKDF
ncbi:MAG TPA: 1,2-phenylacetyl-CoA epoxidase subunit PaaD [Gemmatimonadaceae bacterium]|nr:1,2-phenylacetyl-CoA epoxidase subunit PaaD [Gemmatimonadaceae bacterium]